MQGSKNAPSHVVHTLVVFEVTYSAFNSLHAGEFFMLLLLSADFMHKSLFQKLLSGTLLRVSSGLKPVKNQHSFSPDLDWVHPV